MMTVLFTCKECGSGVHVYPDTNTPDIECHICGTQFKAHFTKEHEASILKDCPECERKDFYKQVDFNRKIGVLLYLIPTALCIFWGLLEGILAYFVFWLIDLFLFKKLNTIANCYKCNAIFKNVKNIKEIEDFNHEMNDRIVYSDQDFQGKPLEH